VKSFSINKILVVMLASGALSACGTDSDKVDAIKEKIETGTFNEQNTAYTTGFEEGSSYPWTVEGTGKLTVFNDGRGESEKSLLVAGQTDWVNNAVSIELNEYLDPENIYGFSTWLKVNNIVELLDQHQDIDIDTLAGVVFAKYTFADAGVHYVQVAPVIRLTNDWAELKADFTAGIEGIEEEPTSIKLEVRVSHPQIIYQIDDVIFEQPTGATATGGVTRGSLGSAYFENFESQDVSYWNASNPHNGTLATVADAKFGSSALFLPARFSDSDTVSVNLVSNLNNQEAYKEGRNEIDGIEVDPDAVADPAEYNFSTWIKLANSVTLNDNADPVTATIIAKYTWHDDINEDDVVDDGEVIEKFTLVAPTVALPVEDITADDYDPEVVFDPWTKMSALHTIGVDGITDEPTSIEFLIQTNYKEAELVVDEFTLAGPTGRGTRTGGSVFIYNDVYNDDFTDGDTTGWMLSGAGAVAVVQDGDEANNVMSVTGRTGLRDRVGVELINNVDELSATYGVTASIKLANPEAFTTDVTARVVAIYTYPDPSDDSMTVEEIVVVADNQVLNDDWLTYNANYKLGVNAYDVDPTSIVLSIESNEPSAELLIDNVNVGATIFGAAESGGTPITTVVEIWLEAECAGHLGGDWVITDDELASGGQYVVDPKVGGVDVSPTNDGSEDQIHLKYNVPVTSDNAGDYDVYIRFIGHTDGGQDSIYLEVNDGGFQKKEPTDDEVWLWESIGTYTFNPGNNLLDFSMREDGFQIDKIYVGSSLPTELGEDATNCN